jgi:ankyrin repeat protein/phosphohistidine swiveling domain-containing protein
MKNPETINSLENKEEGKERIIELIKGNNKTELLDMLKNQEIDVNEKIWNGNTLIMAAVNFGQLNLANDLIDKGANLNLQNKFGQTVLFFTIAANINDANFVKKLLANGASTVWQDENHQEKRNILHYALYKANPEIMALLKQNMDESEAKTGEIEKELSAADEALREAILKGELAEVENALNRGADVNLQIMKNTGTALSFACMEGHQDIVFALIDKGADVNRIDDHQATPLHYSMSGKNYQEKYAITRKLIEAGAFPSACNNSYNPDANRAAASSLDHFKLFTDNHANLNNIGPRSGSTAAHMAVYCPNEAEALEILKIINQNGFDFDKKNNRNMTPISLAMKKDYQTVVKFLSPLTKDIPADVQVLDDPEKMNPEFLYISGWLNPSGKFCICAAGQHAETAEAEHDSNEAELGKKGWLKISEGNILADSEEIKKATSQQLRFLYKFLQDRGRLNEMQSESFDLPKIKEIIKSGEAIYTLEEAHTSEFLISKKGRNLGEMIKLGLPVPAGFIISTKACKEYKEHNKDNKISEKIPEDLWQEIAFQIKKLEEKTGKKFGDKQNPLFVSVRSGAAASMPGMMETHLNIGLNNNTALSLAIKTKMPKKVLSAFINMLNSLAQTDIFFNDINLSELNPGEIVTAINRAYRTDPFLKNLAPLNPERQLKRAIKQIIASWNAPRAKDYRKIKGIPDELGTAVIVQEMKVGFGGEKSGTGVVFSRDPTDGEKGPRGDYLENSQGEEVVSGKRRPLPLSILLEKMPDVHEEIIRGARKLEKHFKRPQDIEITIEGGKLYFLQTRNAKETSLSAIVTAYDMHQEGILEKEEALKMISKYDFKKADIEMIPLKMEKKAITAGIPANPGVASGEIVFSSQEAIEKAKKGTKVVLVTYYADTNDVAGVQQAAGSVAISGGKYCHAAIVARDIGRPCIVGCEAINIDDNKESITIKRKKKKPLTLEKGNVVTIDGLSGCIYVGKVKDTNHPYKEKLQEISTWYNNNINN